MTRWPFFYLYIYLFIVYPNVYIMFHQKVQHWSVGKCYLVFHYNVVNEEKEYMTKWNTVFYVG